MPVLPDAALVIRNNSALLELQLGSLNSVMSNASTTIVIVKNPSLRIDPETWYELGGGTDRVKLDDSYSADEESKAMRRNHSKRSAVALIQGHDRPHIAE
ncbi:hypothetical protein KIN20_030174 [Parelaphostrongylus tenuis]|uniref:Receptor L-domain domain-containing protein n=1 Tax=Parelaphostrongylus tenuis TaxID=148309 RepID=A0AAD5R3C1_PARTN|nr:hypothetical protein KIN20_030174 [Parelaphostrongylus tenuis]